MDQRAIMGAVCIRWILYLDRERVECRGLVVVLLVHHDDACAKSAGGRKWLMNQRVWLIRYVAEGNIQSGTT